MITMEQLPKGNQLIRMEEKKKRRGNRYGASDAADDDDYNIVISIQIDFHEMLLLEMWYFIGKINM